MTGSRSEFKALLNKHNLPNDPSDANIEAFTGDCELIVQRERARLLSHLPAKPKHECSGPWQSHNPHTEEPRE